MIRNIDYVKRELRKMVEFYYEQRKEKVNEDFMDTIDDLHSYADILTKVYLGEAGKHSYEEAEMFFEMHKLGYEGFYNMSELTYEYFLDIVGDLEEDPEEED